MGRQKDKKAEKLVVTNKDTSSSKTVKQSMKVCQSIKIKSYDSDGNIFNQCPKKGLSNHEIRNVVINFDKFQHGELSSEIFRRCGENFISERLKIFDVYSFETASIIKRVTALKFHPKDPGLFAVGDKVGGVILRDLNDSRKTIRWDGTGAGGTITSISFDPFTTDCLLTSSIDGTVKKRSYGYDKCKVLLDTCNFEKWYCSVNASQDTSLVVAGDTSGFLTILDKKYTVISSQKLHKGKINTIEFNKSRSWLMATASLDRTVKVWDLRKIDSRTPLNELPHNHPINAAYFSEVDGNRILTTDQNCELRVYKAPSFDIENIIIHPHRHFQHLTAIRASWHPLTDLIIAGRYPDPTWPSYTQGELRTVDVYSASTGEMKAQLYSFSCKGIISLNAFNSSGEIMASCMGHYVAYWKARVLRDRLEDSEKRGKKGDDSDQESQPLPKVVTLKPNTLKKKKKV